MADNATDPREAKRRKQLKKMTKIVAKAWSIPNAEPFQEVTMSSKEAVPLDLTAIGQSLDAGHYQHGRSGWEKFAKDIGGVYNWRIASNSKHARAAKKQIEEVGKFLAKVDPQLADLASKHCPPESSYAEATRRSSSKKRKASGQNGHEKNVELPVPKKKHASGSHTTTETLTLSQREHKAMEALGAFLEECGGERSQMHSFRCKASQRSADRFDVVYFSSEGRRLRSMIEVARLLGLAPDDKMGAGASSSKKQNNAGHKSRRPNSFRECESEKKKLRKELDKLVKAHGKATKALDDFRNDHGGDRVPVDDELLIEEEKDENVSQEETRRRCTSLTQTSGVDDFPAIPAHCTPDVLMAWDFLCTFGRALSLEPVRLDDFVAALTYKPKADDSESNNSNAVSQPSSMPVYLAEVHLSLLKLLLQDPSSDEWWWSTLEVDETIAEGTDEGAAAAETNKSNNKSDEQLSPIIKIDMAALLAIDEDPNVTARWLQALEDVRLRRTNSGGPIKSAVKSALAVTTNQLVQSYLKKAMRKWKGNAAGFTKRAVIWLVDRVREARPDLWGRKVSEEAVAQQKTKVAQEVALVMDQVDEDVDVDNMNESNSDDGSIDDSDSDDTGEDDEEEDGYEEVASGASSANDPLKLSQTKRDDSVAQVTSSIPVKPPPSLVDLLLPPTKPVPSSDLVTPFTWPCLAGAASCRILHRYKRQRNEVDDSLRESRELPALSIAERKKRESVAPQRILSECAASCSLASEEEMNPTEAAIEHLCSGNDYLQLTPVQKLCVLRVLIEAAYDTSRVHRVVEDNFKARINAVKALETEERRAKREAREEAARGEAAARERLAFEAKNAFLQRKRREISRKNEHTNEFSAEFIDGLTDDDIAEFDDETRSEYRELPSPENFNKSEVNAMVATLQEEAAFDTNGLLVLTLEEIQSREKSNLSAMEERLASFGDVDSVYQHHTADRETSAKIDRLQREVANLKEMELALPHSRSAAIEALKEAIEDGTIKALRNAIKGAKLAKLSGLEEATNGLWALDLLRDAALELRNAERRKRVTEAQKDLVAKRNKCFTRTEPLGRDRYWNSFWKFDSDESGRVWVENNYLLTDCSNVEKETNASSVNKSEAFVGEVEKEEDLLSNDLLASREEKEKNLRFSRQEYFSSGQFATLVKHRWGYYSTDQSLRLLVKQLDSRGVREGALKVGLKEILETKAAEENAHQEGQENSSTEKGADSSLDHVHGDASRQAEMVYQNSAAYQNSADEEIFQRTISSSMSKDEEVGKLLRGISSALGQRVRLRRIADPVTAPMAAQYEMGTISGWKMNRTTQHNPDDRMDSPSNVNEDKIPLWRLTLDKGEEVDLLGTELIDGLCRAIKWKYQYEGYVEADAPFLSYRNPLGRFCGRASDAPLSSSPMAFSRQMLRREQELYQSLKNRSYENNWGGKSGARNAWIGSMRENGHNFNSVREGLLTLENAFFELSGGFSQLQVTDAEGGASVDASSETLSGRSMLDDRAYRFEIELESIGGAVRGLWNSRETRAIFMEIVETSTTIGFLSLGLDLLCRNCTAYLTLTRPTATRNSLEQPAGTRRLNAWQQAHQNSYFL